MTVNNNQPQALQDANQGPPAEINWDPAPARAKAKAVYDAGFSALGNFAKTPAKKASALVYGETPLNDAIVEITINKSLELIKRSTDAFVDNSCTGPDDLSSRVARLYQ